MKRVRKNISFDKLESRTVLAAFSVLDSFSGASPGDDAMESGGTGIPAGIVANSSDRSFDIGVDTGLQASDPLQAADVRTVSVTRAGLVSIKAATVADEGYLGFSADILTVGTLVLEYDLDHVLTGDGQIEIDFSFLDPGAGDSIVASVVINGSTVLTDFDIAPDGGVVGAEATATFDASALIGQQIDEMVFTISANEASDMSIDQINAPLESQEQAATPLRRGLALGLQKQLGDEIAVKKKSSILKDS